jgi:hypothetical protein
MKLIAGMAGAILLAAILVSGAFLALNKACSLGDSPIVGQQIQKSGDDKHPQSTETGQQGASPQGEKPKPSARFELRKTDTNKVEGRYYAENAGQEKEAWSHKFFCDTKIGEFALAVFTFVLVIFTGGLWWSTHGLLQAGNAQIRQASYISRLQDLRTKESIRLAEEADKTSRIAANAAKDSAEAAISVQRARFYAVITHNFMRTIEAANSWAGPEDQKSNPIGRDLWPKATIVFKNYGKTPGILKKVGIGVAYADTPPDPPDYKPKRINENIIDTGEISEKFDASDESPMTIYRAKNVQRGESATIWIYGYAAYDDVFGKEQTHRFYQRFTRIGVSPDRYVLQSYDYKDYNKST